MSETPSAPSASVAPSAPSTSAAAAIPNNYGVATSMADVQNQINEMEAFFEAGATLPVDFRLRQLRRLQAYLLAHEREALDALHADLGKSAFESYAPSWGSFTTRSAFT